MTFPCQCPHCASEGFVPQGPECYWWNREPVPYDPDDARTDYNDPDFY